MFIDISQLYYSFPDQQQLDTIYTCSPQVICYHHNCISKHTIGSTHQTFAVHINTKNFPCIYYHFYLQQGVMEYQYGSWSWYTHNGSVKIVGTSISKFYMVDLPHMKPCTRVYTCKQMKIINQEEGYVSITTYITATIINSTCR